MKASGFQYARPSSLEEACALLAEHGSDARILAGGQSMFATLNLRLSAPSLLIDINRIEELKGIVLAEDASHVRIGALVRHAETASSPLVEQHLPLLHMAMRHVAHPAVRNRGTTCGSLALADPSAEMPACAITLDALLVLQSRDGGVREVPAVDYFFGLYETARQDDEILIEALYPACQPDEVFGFDELARRHGDFAMVGVALRARHAQGLISDLRLTTFGTDPMPILSAAAAGLAEGQPWSEPLGEAIAAAAVAELEPDHNHFGSPEVKRLQARALIRRVLTATFGAPADSFLPSGARHG
ncbi:MAG TPA: xanthine dehydrogenase family protein subunit M [Herbaspirillum sp.]|uniref:FAD binding domain-containing protein n=1 Tax=Herbaspirillum sp. TaxID=1890675 RepID=UPI002D2ECB20|nr:xanthine dehydrogenase family protein subunit M [Herbaspirillum sp.]HZG18579.1 xanthine dehydrogenase family protein subunit M [Herbaspirillum sp.]